MDSTGEIGRQRARIELGNDHVLRMYNTDGELVYSDSTAELPELPELPHVHDLRPLLHLRDDRLVFEVQLTAKVRYPFQCKACGHVEWHTAERAVELGLVLVPEATR